MSKRRRRNKANPFAQKKRDRKNQGTDDQKPDKRSEPYQAIVRENADFIKYYKHQQICPDNEWKTFLTYVRDNLPTTFRITGCREETKSLLELIESEIFDRFLIGSNELKTNAENVVTVPTTDAATGTTTTTTANNTNNESLFTPPMCLSWYPNRLAWQLELTRKDIRRSEAFYKLHNFLISETNAGSISRQEAVSMIPPLVLDVKSHHRVLDMCAAPGSKTAQLIEALHADHKEIPTGFVIANDIDNNRCYMLVHQAKRLNSPCLMVTNHDSSVMPNFYVNKPAVNNDGGNTTVREELKFDRILCDVPCSGDGTMRKNPDIWLKWNCGMGLSLHGLQYRIVKRGCEMLAIGGRLVYSTCSFNPIENEAVLYRLLKECDGAMEIVDASNLLPNLVYKPGMLYWEPATRDIQFYKSFEDVPEKFHTILRPNLFAPSDPNEARKYNIDKCMRILPHQQNTGGFFVAVLQKRSALPWEQKIVLSANKLIESTTTPTGNETGSTTENDNNKRRAAEPPTKRRRNHGFREDPYVFFNENDEIWKSLKTFYNISDKFNPLCLLTRCIGGKKKNVYFCSEAIRDLVLTNENIIKIINTGVKTFVRCDNRNMVCAFRLANEGLQNINHLLGPERRITLNRTDLIILLNNTIPTKPPMLVDLHAETRTQCDALTPGSCILEFSDERFSVKLVGWRGVHSLRAYTDINDTIHILRLLRADVSKYDKNKFDKNKNDDSDGGGNDAEGESEVIVDNKHGSKMTDDNNKDDSSASDDDEDEIDDK